MHIKTTMRYHFTSVGMASIKKMRNNKCWWRYVEKGTLLVGMQNGAAIVGNKIKFPKKLKLEIPCDPVNILLGIYLKEKKLLIQKDIYVPLCLFFDLQ